MLFHYHLNFENFLFNYLIKIHNFQACPIFLIIGFFIFESKSFWVQKQVNNYSKLTL